MTTTGNAKEEEPTANFSFQPTFATTIFDLSTSTEVIRGRDDDP